MPSVVSGVVSVIGLFASTPPPETVNQSHDATTMTSQHDSNTTPSAKRQQILRCDQKLRYDLEDVSEEDDDDDAERLIIDLSQEEILESASRPANMAAAGEKQLYSVRLSVH